MYRSIIFILFLCDYRFDIYHWKSGFIWLVITIKEAGLINLIHITEKKDLRIIERTSFVGLMPFVERINLIGFLDSTRTATARLNYATEFCKTICPNLVQVKSLNKSVAGLNQPYKLSGLSVVTIIIYRHWPFL